MRSDIKDYLYNICNKENIRVVWLENLSPYTPPSASFEHRCIVMNPNWHNKFEFTFQLAHEIAHCCIHANTLKKSHIELRSAIEATTPKEYKTNIFAGELLMPETVLRDIHSRYLIAPPLSNISQIFKVSTNVMSARLDYLNLPYIRDIKPNYE